MKSTRRKQRTQPLSHGQRYVLLQYLFPDLRATVNASMSRIDCDRAAIKTHNLSTG